MSRASQERQFLGAISEFDQVAFKQAMSKRSKEEKQIIAYVMTGASWSKVKLEEIGRADDDRCELCGISPIPYGIAPKSMRGSSTKQERASSKFYPSTCNMGSLG